ncbi:MAG: hypothetical protein JWP90_2414, partial [Mycetocola sp.]|nr:hypothetical protein [Mycetocola sp.]
DGDADCSRFPCLRTESGRRLFGGVDTWRPSDLSKADHRDRRDHHVVRRHLRVHRPQGGVHGIGERRPKRRHDRSQSHDDQPHAPSPRREASSWFPDAERRSPHRPLTMTSRSRPPLPDRARSFGERSGAGRSRAGRVGSGWDAPRRPEVLLSGPCRDRTDDIHGVNVALYQLS